ncbi:MAG TPA: hypothetical protein DHW42_09965 [Candidatus Marinimicrobia bacterium]|nr:hypothetical protein [Candidatus Neomarinimicrobiota bacterium]
MSKKIELSRGIDAWSAVHLLGCYFLMTIIKSWVIVLCLAIWWEFLDFCYSYLRYQVPEWVSSIFDPRGADIMDIVFDAIGIGLYIGLAYLNFV